MGGFLFIAAISVAQDDIPGSTEGSDTGLCVDLIISSLPYLYNS